MTSIVFLDTETTGVELDADVWEVAAIRRNQRGQETTIHAFVDHDPDKCAKLPEPFLSDHRERFPVRCGEITSVANLAHVLTRRQLGSVIGELFAPTRDAGPPHLVGAVPDFDTTRLEPYLQRANVTERWHYHLIDVETLVVGFLFGRYGTFTGPPVEAEGEAVQLPWDSNKLSMAVGVNPDDYERHTAMGDVMWVRAQFDAVTKPGGAEDTPVCRFDFAGRDTGPSEPCILAAGHELDGVNHKREDGAESALGVSRSLCGFKGHPAKCNCSVNLVGP